MVRKLENRSLDRGIDLLVALAQAGPCTLHGLHERTGLAKSTIRRLLGTLLERHVVRKGLGDGLYRSNVVLPLPTSSALTTTSALLVTVASPHMLALTERVEWPSDLHLYVHDRMRIIKSTRPFSPFCLYRVRIDFDVSMFAAASGLAYLSTLDAPRVGSLVASLAPDQRWGPGRFGWTRASLLSHLARVRAQGYASRLEAYRGESVADDKLSAIAVPLMVGGAGIGALTLCWPRQFCSPEKFAKRHLGELVRTAQVVGGELERSASMRRVGQGG